MDQLIVELTKIIDKIYRDKQIKGENRYVLVDGKVIDLVNEISVVRTVVSRVADEYPNDATIQSLLDRIIALEQNPSGATAEQLTQIEDNSNQIILLENDIENVESRVATLENAGTGGSTDLTDLYRKIGLLEKKNKQQDINLIKESLRSRIVDEATGYQAKIVSNFTELAVDDLSSDENLFYLSNCIYDTWERGVSGHPESLRNFKIDPVFHTSGQLESNFLTSTYADSYNYIRFNLWEITSYLEVYLDGIRVETTGMQMPNSQRVNVKSVVAKVNNTIHIYIVSEFYETGDLHLYKLTKNIDGSVLCEEIPINDPNSFLDCGAIIYSETHQTLAFLHRSGNYSTYDVITDQPTNYANLSMEWMEYRINTWDKFSETLYTLGYAGLYQINFFSPTELVLTTTQIQYYDQNSTFNSYSGLMYKKDNSLRILFCSDYPNHTYNLDLTNFYMTKTLSNEALTNHSFQGYGPDLYVREPDPYYPEYMIFDVLFVGGLINSTTNEVTKNWYFKPLNNSQYDPTWSNGEWYIETDDIYTETPIDVAYAYIGYTPNSHGTLNGISFSRDFGTTWSPRYQAEEEVDISNQPISNGLRMRVYFEHNAMLLMYGFGGLSR